MTFTKKKEIELIKKKTEFVMVNVPFIGTSTKPFIRRLQQLAKKRETSYQVFVVPQPPPTVGQDFNNKDIISKNMQSEIVYHLTGNHCPSQYIGQITRQAIRRMIEHGYCESPSNSESTSIIAAQTDSTDIPLLRRSDRLKEKRKKN
ncbi:unnamed protein product [Rotaria sp. Silwood1]|nr:unnamed protein product [Rotaria sp. Silwood1]